MEVSVIGSSQTKICGMELAYSHNHSFSRVFLSPRRGSVSFWEQGAKLRKATMLRYSLKTVRSQAVRSDNVAVPKPAEMSRSLQIVRLFVGLPLDTVCNRNTINHARAIAAGLKALKLLGVEGVELPVWWGVAEKEAMGKYDWSGYLAVAEMVQQAGLKLHVSLCFHASKQPKVPLPDWVMHVGDAQHSIYFTDRSGNQYKECLSYAVDELPVLDGKSPIQVYHDFCESFKSAFSPFMGNTITGITIGLGPDGELRYPSHHRLAKNRKVPGVGEFQCYDKNMLGILKQHALATGNPLWGLGGPHDAASYDESPHSNGFFKNGGSWESAYGDFFLSWYSNQLVSHGNRMLSLGSSSFSDIKVPVYGKLPLLHSWYKTQSRPSELTAGFYNTRNRDGYDAVAEVFAKNSCKVILPGMDLADELQSPESLSSPESLLAQIRKACRNHGVEIAGQNSWASGVARSFEQIKKNLSQDSVMDLFTYQRMGAYFFSPEHFPVFTGFVRSLGQLELQRDDLPVEVEDEIAGDSLHRNPASGAQMQAV